MKIKSCPFCGSKPAIDQNSFYNPETKTHGFMLKVYCQIGCCETAQSDEPLEEVVRQWNTRRKQKLFDIPEPITQQEFMVKA
jgi:hypothetical protein